MRGITGQCYTASLIVPSNWLFPVHANISRYLGALSHPSDCTLKGLDPFLCSSFQQRQSLLMAHSYDLCIVFIHHGGDYVKNPRRSIISVGNIQYRGQEEGVRVNSDIHDRVKGIFQVLSLLREVCSLEIEHHDREWCECRL